MDDKSLLERVQDYRTTKCRSPVSARHHRIKKLRAASSGSCHEDIGAAAAIATLAAKQQKPRTAPKAGRKALYQDDAPSLATLRQRAGADSPQAHGGAKIRRYF